MEEKDYNLPDVMQLATDAGHIMLENGAEIFRVEETMEETDLDLLCPRWTVMSLLLLDSQEPVR